MGSATKIVVSGLNITAFPHPKGIYEEILKQSADVDIHLGGSDFAKITAPEIIPDTSVAKGRICVWTEIAKDGDWFNKIKNDKASDDDKKKIYIPENIAPNYRYFFYAMDLVDHILIFESKTENNHSFGHKRAVFLFGELFGRLPTGGPSVDVTVIPEEGSVDVILNMPRLKRLKIHLTKPNPEDVSDDFARVMNKMNLQNAKSWNQELVKETKVEKLLPDLETKTLAYIAETNGFVEGQSSDGIKESTQEHPKCVTVRVEENGSSIQKFLSTLAVFASVAKSIRRN